MPTQERLRELFDYDQGLGRFINRIGRKNSPKGKMIVGQVDSRGYLAMKINDHKYPMHRLIWVWHKGPIPIGQEIDHFDQDKKNPCIENLRLVTSSENNRNRRRAITNRSGTVGVCWHKRNKRWDAYILRTKLGSFKIKKEAVAARKAAERKLGFSPNHGREIRNGKTFEQVGPATFALKK